MKCMIKILFVIGLGLTAGIGFATQVSHLSFKPKHASAVGQQVQNPVTLIHDTVVELQQKIHADHANLKKSPIKLFKLVKSILMPHIDVDQMAGMVLGRMWNQATPEQQKTFIDEFGLLLTRTYANALLKASEYKVTIYPLRSDAWKKSHYVAVTGIVQPNGGGAASKVIYYLEREGSGWKIYDFAIEGVSIMQNFHSQFQSMGNVAASIKKLRELNQKHHDDNVNYTQGDQHANVAH